MSKLSGDLHQEFFISRLWDNTTEQKKKINKLKSEINLAMEYKKIYQLTS